MLIQYTDIEWLPCDGFLALLAVLLPLVCTVQVCTITGCELDMSNSQHGYKWMKVLCFWKQETGKRLKLIHLVANLSLLPPKQWRI